MGKKNKASQIRTFPKIPRPIPIFGRHFSTNEVMWLRDLLPGLFPNARIASYSYKFDWRNDVKTSLRECAQQFLNQLCQNRSRDQVSQGAVNPVLVEPIC